jgi:hypothetical protein
MVQNNCVQEFTVFSYRYFDNLDAAGIAVMPPENIINMDETCMNWAAARERLIIRRGQRWARQDKACSHSAATVAFTISADGLMLPPFIIFKVRFYLQYVVAFFAGDVRKTWFS